MSTSDIRSLVASLALVLLVCGCSTSDGQARRANDTQIIQENSMQVQYLEIVTSDVEATCAALAKLHEVTFADPDLMLGGARTAALKNGGRIGVRAPMAEHEEPVVRPYVLVEDIEAAVNTAKESGAEIAMPSTDIPGKGKFAIYIQGGIQYGLWQL